MHRQNDDDVNFHANTRCVAMRFYAENFPQSIFMFFFASNIDIASCKALRRRTWLNNGYDVRYRWISLSYKSYLYKKGLLVQFTCYVRSRICVYASPDHTCFKQVTIFATKLGLLSQICGLSFNQVIRDGVCVTLLKGISTSSLVYTFYQILKTEMTRPRC